MSRRSLSIFRRISTHVLHFVHCCILQLLLINTGSVWLFVVADQRKTKMDCQLSLSAPTVLRRYSNFSSALILLWGEFVRYWPRFAAKLVAMSLLPKTAYDGRRLMLLLVLLSQQSFRAAVASSCYFRRR